MTPLTKKYSNEAASLAIWDPDEEGLTPKVDINVTKINHLTKRYLKEVLPKDTDESFEKAYGLNMYGVPKHHMTAVNLMLLTGKISLSKYLALTKEGLTSAKLFPGPTEDLKEFVSDCREMARELETLRQRPADITVAGTTYSIPNNTVAVDALLGDVGLPKLSDIFREHNVLIEATGEANENAKHLQTTLELNEETEATLRKQLQAATLKAEAVPLQGEYEANESKEIPSGKVTLTNVKDVFPDLDLAVDFEVPVWAWDGPHPMVPEVDPKYILRPKQLVRVLYAIVTNQRAYLQGHTGAGKTTLLEQVAAHLKWPFIRINFDSEITRMDLIGRDTLRTNEEGSVVSCFEDGMLPTAMSGPNMVCFDELDFVRPDVAYVMQAALEGGGLRITEDGDRLVRPHPMFRMFGTGNTVGQGDEHGMYQGARPQSIAFLDRFTIWMKVDYLKEDERETLVKDTFPAMDDSTRKTILQYTSEHLEAFTQGKVIQPISPRGILAICRAATTLGNVKEALEMTVLDRANIEDRATLKGLVDRVAR